MSYVTVYERDGETPIGELQAADWPSSRYRHGDVVKLRAPEKLSLEPVMVDWSERPPRVVRPTADLLIAHAAEYITGKGRELRLIADDPQKVRQAVQPPD